MRDSEEVYRKVSKRRKGQLKKTREPRSRLDLAILFVQSAFPIVILLVTRCETTPFIAKTVRVPIQRISIGCGGGNRRDRRPVVAAGLDVGRARIGCSSVQICPTIGLRIPSPYRTFKKILSKFCSSDILISFLIFGKIDRSTKIIDRHRSFHLLIFGRECSKFNNVIFIISAEIF